MRDRLLSPNEAKFWLLDHAEPMNSVIVVQRDGGFPGIDAPRTRFRLPTVQTDAQARPRWHETPAAGEFRRHHSDSETGWLAAAQALLTTRAGTGDAPPWIATVLAHPGGETLLLAVNHALTDWRTSLHVADCFIADTHPGELMPACEEMLPPACFADPEAEALIEAWFLPRAASRWQALGLDALAAVLPGPSATRLALARLDAAASAALHERCETEGATLNGAVAVALRDVLGLDRVAHAIDMARFIRPAPPPGPELAVAHVFTPVEQGAFWEAARDNRAALFEQVRSGAAGDALLALPRALLHGAGAPAYARAGITITGAPTTGAQTGRSGPAAATPDPMRLVLSSARGGGGVLILSYWRGALQLIAGTPQSEPDLPLAALLDRLRAASSREP